MKGRPRLAEVAEDRASRPKRTGCADFRQLGLDVPFLDQQIAKSLRSLGDPSDKLIVLRLKPGNSLRNFCASGGFQFLTDSAPLRLEKAFLVFQVAKFSQHHALRQRPTGQIFLGSLTRNRRNLVTIAKGN